MGMFDYVTCLYPLPDGSPEDGPVPTNFTKKMEV